MLQIWITGRSARNETQQNSRCVRSVDCGHDHASGPGGRTGVGKHRFGIRGCQVDRNVGQSPTGDHAADEYSRQPHRRRVLQPCGLLRGDRVLLFEQERHAGPYVVTETNGRWSKIKVFNLSALRMTKAGAFGEFVACPSAGNCSVIGSYTTDTQGDLAPFTVTERNGTWGKAHAPPGFNGFVESLGCTSAGNCVAGGDGPFVVSEKNGVWGHAEALPGTSGMNIQAGSVNSISCTGDSCLGVGTYTVGIDLVIHQFVAVAKKGVWGPARPIPGLPSDDPGVGPGSCSPGGTCTVLASSSSSPTEFTLSEKNGTWNTRPNHIPGVLASQSTFTSLACPSAGNCSADGNLFTDPSVPSGLPLVVAEHNGTWSKAEVLPGLFRLNHHGNSAHQALIGSLSCGAPGDCAAAGSANVNGSAADPHDEALVVNEVGGRWHFAQVFPGIVRLEGQGTSEGEDVACWSASHCAAGGFYQQNTPTPFVVTER